MSTTCTSDLLFKGHYSVRHVEAVWVSQFITGRAAQVTRPCHLLLEDAGLLEWPQLVSIGTMEHDPFCATLFHHMWSNVLGNEQNNTAATQELHPVKQTGQQKATLNHT